MYIKNLFTQGGNCIYEDDDYVEMADIEKMVYFDLMLLP